MCEKYRFCKIFVRSAEPPVLMQLIAGLLGENFALRTLTLPTATVDVLKNPDAKGDSDDFLFWPSMVEIEARDPIDPQEILTTARRTLVALWEAGFPAVAASDFEDELPWRGGVDRLSPGT
ncbi:hypothetical protein ACFWF7_16040 [Nocardia sp. NPDC060256]|uniref:hypothetical protein n=1 Tax=unclassified Nocardia TaxID=2637762 RepID=UPI00366A323C